MSLDRIWRREAWRLLVMLAVRPTLAGTVALPTAGLTVTVDEPLSPARLALTARGRHQVELRVDGPLTAPLELRLELASTGPLTWPTEELCVVDGGGEPVPLVRAGTEWHQARLAVAAGTYLVRATPLDPAPPRPPEAQRTVTDPGRGVTAAIDRWPDGRRAAFSLRFDDSHPSHLSTVLPLLRQHGFRATFMICPGTADFAEHRDAWAAMARQGDQELANHTLDHRGATTEAEIERAVGDAAAAIRALSPHPVGLLAFNRGGGTTWVTRQPFSVQLARHHLFSVTGSLGMDDVYGDRPIALARHLDAALERGSWAKAHYHAVGPGLGASEASFRSGLEQVAGRADRLWIAGLADVQKYQAERAAASLILKPLAPDRLALGLICGTAPRWYDQPLSISLTLPTGWSPETMTLRDEAGRAVAAHAASDRSVVRYQLPPVTARYVVEAGR